MASANDRAPAFTALSVDDKPHVPPTPAAGDAAYEVVKLFPTTTRFVTGIARSYDDDFPPELAPLVKREHFETAINQINNTLKDYWPCALCVCCGYVCCPCTLGISLLCPNLCLRDAEQYVRALIARINKRACFASVDVEWRLVRSCGRSWIEISFPTTSKPIVETYQQPGRNGPTTANRSTTTPSSATSTSRLIHDV